MKAALSLRARLLFGILAPVAIFIVINSVSLYRQSLAAATTAYDRTLLASAKTIGEQLDVEGYDEAARHTGAARSWNSPRARPRCCRRCWRGPATR